MRIIFANQKGGVGKSTLCILFANYLASKNKSVAIIDTDLQCTASEKRKKDAVVFEDVEVPYPIQLWDTQKSDITEFMQQAKEVQGAVLFDTPGNISDDSILPVFLNADAIICPYEYSELALDSTGTFIQVIQQLERKFPEMRPQLIFVPNKVRENVGTASEQDIWKKTDDIFRQFGQVSPRVKLRANVGRLNTYQLMTGQVDSCKETFDFIIAQLGL